MAVEFSADALEQLRVAVLSGLPHWNLSPDTAVELLNVSENATFSLREPAGGVCVLRIHRVGYSPPAEIRSELAWLEALRADGVVETARPIAGADGELVQTLTVPGGAARSAVMFQHLPGAQPDVRDALPWFERLGEATAKLHAHARGWALPTGFVRKRWDVDAMVGPRALWGPWRAAAGLTPPGMRVLEDAILYIRGRLTHFGTGIQRFGLIHADLRLANLLVDGAQLRIIDFDDCGLGWFAYDFAAAVSFIEQDSVMPALLESWCTGYRRTAVLEAEAVAEMPTFVVLRRILLTAWLASHPEVPLARQLGAAFTEGTLDLADRLLRGTYLSSS